jgi:hypothetical protein
MVKPVYPPYNFVAGGIITSYDKEDILANHKLSLISSLKRNIMTFVLYFGNLKNVSAAYW